MALSVAFSYAQSRPGSVKGTVKDKRTGEVIPFATVIVKDRDVVLLQELLILTVSLISVQ